MQHLANLTSREMYTSNRLIWESRNISGISPQPGEINNRKSKVIAFALNANMNVVINDLCYQNGNRKYKYLVLGRQGSYFVKEQSDSKSKYTEEDIIRMVEFLVDNI